MSSNQSSNGRSPNPTHQNRGSESPAFLLAQLGAHAAARFAERLGPLGLTPAHVGSLRMIAAAEGASQQDVAERLGMFPSRLVGLVDELQERGLVERLPNESDRRTHSLRITKNGRQSLVAIGRIAREHQEALLASLTKDERDALAALLLRVADQQGLRRGVHPGFARLRPQSGDTPGLAPRKAKSKT
jgi:DNA-binding MarR family transcriptional regulator